MAEQQKTAASVAEAEAVDLGEFSQLLEKDFKVKKDDSEKLQQLVRNLALAAQSRSETTTISSNSIKSIKEQLRAIPLVIAVTVGADRAAALHAAITGGIVKSVVIDDAGASALLQHAGVGAAPETVKA